MVSDVDFDALVQKTMASNEAIEDLNNLYGAAFSLENWHFIARGDFPDVSPYVASNAQYADNLPMVRAFTDTERLLRFAKENNLTDAEGSALILSLPTEKIVEYLEQFISRDVYGIWFNSDIESKGFYAPLKQLRPIKEHLEKTNWKNSAKDSPAAPLENTSEPPATVDALAKLLEENAELIKGYDEENAVLSAVIAGSAAALDTRPEEEKGDVISNVAEILESVRAEYNMSRKLFEFFIELCLEKRKFIIPILAFALGLREEDKAQRLKQDKELTQELTQWIINKLIPGSDVLSSPAGERALTLKQRFSFSKLDTLILHGGIGRANVGTSGNICTLSCDKNIKAPPAEIVEVKEIKEIIIEFCPNLDLAATFLRLGDMPNLQKLWLKNCGIREIPAEIWGLYRLWSLSFSNVALLDANEFAALPPEIGLLENLRELNLCENREFKRFPPEVAKLEKLNRLNLRGFNSLPENIELIPNLKDLYLVFSGIVPAHVEPLLDRANPLESVTVGEHYFESFQKLAEKYPNFRVGWEHTTFRGDY